MHIGVFPRGRIIVVVSRHRPAVVTDRSDIVVLEEERAGELRVAGVRLRDRLAKAVGRARERLSGRTPGVVFVAGDALVDDDQLVALSSVVGAGGAIVAGDDVRRPAALALPVPPSREPRSAAELAELAQGIERQGNLQRVPAAGVCRRVTDRDQARRATRDLIALMWRSTDGFFARRFDRYISTALSPWFARWGVSPNAITLVATVVGLAGACALAQLDLEMSLVGAALVIASTILDGCDGEVARISLRTSPAGRRLDLLGDNIVNVAVFTAIGIRSVRADPGPTMAWVAAAAVCGVVVAAATGLWFSTWLARAGFGERAHVVYERISSRDFVYLVFAFAAFDRLHWFVWMTAAGSFAFALALVGFRVFWGCHQGRSRSYGIEENEGV